MLPVPIIVMALCEKFVRTAFNVGPGYGSAIEAWGGAKYRHGIANTASVPAGVPVYWAGGKYGHVALSTGGGRIISTDFPDSGKIGVGTIAGLTSKWNKQLLGWTEDINGTRIYGLPGLREGGITLNDGLAKLHEGEPVLTKPLGKKFEQGVDNFANGGGNTYNISVDARDTGITSDELTKKIFREIDKREARKPGRRVG